MRIVYKLKQICIELWYRWKLRKCVAKGKVLDHFAELYGLKRLPKEKDKDLRKRITDLHLDINRRVHLRGR